ncbi:MAG: hypothetical protein HY700_18205 [Gemmatimonadetes bacterium]|nr:hypothetical protein [Gemmatimonadota bacterium]
MTWIYDATRDVLTITYGRQDRRAARIVRSPEVQLYLDDRGDCMRAEVIRASARHPVEELNALDAKPDDWCGLASAAKRFGVKQFALREEILSGGMPAVKSGPTWLIRDIVLAVYAEILKARRAAHPGGRDNGSGL